ncbi:hypothetical protein Golob_022728, partial [Gossypium lobatum]|nr:hypothetical protein [Gossypium lobatum]
MEAFLTLTIERELQLHEGYQKTCKNFNGMLPTLPRGKGWWFDQHLQCNCFWLSSYSLRGCLLINDHFKPQPTDIIVSTSPKCSMTWLTALVFAIINRNSYDFTNHPLHKANPQDLALLRSRVQPPLTLEEAFELFCKGVSHYGQFWDHVLDVKKKPLECVRKVAEFLEIPFTPDEENNKIVKEIVELCSFENLSNQEVNKSDVLLATLISSGK